MSRQDGQVVRDFIAAAERYSALMEEVAATAHRDPPPVRLQEDEYPNDDVFDVLGSLLLALVPLYGAALELCDLPEQPQSGPLTTSHTKFAEDGILPRLEAGARWFRLVRDIPNG